MKLWPIALLLAFAGCTGHKVADLIAMTVFHHIAWGIQ